MSDPVHLERGLPVIKQASQSTVCNPTRKEAS
jgi:hypothetical protein